ncbi:hypothetical protein LguiA_003971 [Lonicera macranthoides]
MGVNSRTPTMSLTLEIQPFTLYIYTNSKLVISEERKRIGVVLFSEREGSHF